ncbi:MAG: hypothetical protein KJZ64_00745 [Sphingomonadaceae bacterium]|nr:hypothetical protein [Sphingomonadaceae bacterium]
MARNEKPNLVPDVAAERRYEVQLRILQDRLQFSHDGEVNFVRGLFVANGGAIVALLTFLGRADVLEPRAAFWSFVWLGTGIVFAMLTSLFSMLANNCHFTSNYRRLELERGGFDESTFAWLTTDEALNVKRGNAAHRAMVLVGMLSVASFVTGIFVALDAIT